MKQSPNSKEKNLQNGKIGLIYGFVNKNPVLKNSHNHENTAKTFSFQVVQRHL